MYNQYILIKYQNVLSSDIKDFFKNFLGNKIEIKDDNNIITICHSYDNEEEIFEALSGLVVDYDTKLYAYTSRMDFNETNYNIIKDYFLKEELKENVYNEHKFILELVLKGKTKDLDKVVLSSYYNDINMIETLKAFIENDMNTSKTANAIYMHRNTLINKLDRFTKITGYDIKKFCDAFIIYHLIKK